MTDVQMKTNSNPEMFAKNVLCTLGLWWCTVAAVLPTDVLMQLLQTHIHRHVGATSWCEMTSLSRARTNLTARARSQSSEISVLLLSLRPHIQNIHAFTQVLEEIKGAKTELFSNPIYFFLTTELCITNYTIPYNCIPDLITFHSFKV